MRADLRYNTIVHVFSAGESVPKPEQGRKGTVQAERRLGQHDGRKQNAGRTARGKGADRAGHHHFGAPGERPRKAPRTSAGMAGGDVADRSDEKEAGPSARKQEQAQRRIRELTLASPISVEEKLGPAAAEFFRVPLEPPLNRGGIGCRFEGLQKDQASGQFLVGFPVHLPRKQL